MAEELVGVPGVRAVSDGLVLICELPDGQPLGIPQRFITPSSEVRKLGDIGVLVIT